MRDIAAIVTDRVVVVAPRERSADWKQMLRYLDSVEPDGRR